jgi:hypothetical protein
MPLSKLGLRCDIDRKRERLGQLEEIATFMIHEFPTLREEVLSLFEEAQTFYRAHDTSGFFATLSIVLRCDTCGSGRHVTALCEGKRAKRLRYEKNRYAHRREYKTAWQSTQDQAEIAARLQAGERPTRWGKRWRQAAQAIGLEIPTKAPKRARKKAA